jgi:hypothetical protein
MVKHLMMRGGSMSVTREDAFAFQIPLSAHEMVVARLGVEIGYASVSPAQARHELRLVAFAAMAAAAVRFSTPSLA